MTLAAVFAASASGFENNRARTWEFYIGPQFIGGKTLKFDGGAEAHINDMASLLFGFGYNFDEHFALGATFSSTSANYKGTSVPENGGDPETFASNMYTSSFNITATYNFVEGPFTPYVVANLGTTYIDSGIKTGKEHEGCWWDPWWGYICAPYASTYTANKLNYGAQLGVRYDFGNSVFLKAGIGLDYIDLDTHNGKDFTLYNFSVGFMFR